MWYGKETEEKKLLNGVGAEVTRDQLESFLQLFLKLQSFILKRLVMVEMKKKSELI